MRIDYLVFGIFLLLNKPAFPQSTHDEFFFFFYNVENLFDIQDDPVTEDEEFTPEGSRHWTHYRFRKKLLNISKVILNATEWTPPQMIALCEVENRYVLEQLLQNTPLKKFPYKIIHKESPDPRGIDVAFIYNSDVFYPLMYKFFQLQNSDDSVQKSREIVYVSGILNNTDTLHFFSNHWPSRYLGLMETEHGRKLAAQILNAGIEWVREQYKDPKIIIAGDFNDQPTNESLSSFSGGKESGMQHKKNKIYNLSHSWMMAEIKTIKHQSQWLIFDQILVSGSLLEQQAAIYTKSDWAQIVELPFLLEKDEKYGGFKLKRTYYGYKYQGGFSDHLPVLLKIKTNL
jgi:endonuclease/exonuclease/phosphatase family metal-dependent hydrolase